MDKILYLYNLIMSLKIIPENPIIYKFSEEEEVTYSSPYRLGKGAFGEVFKYTIDKKQSHRHTHIVVKYMKQSKTIKDKLQKNITKLSSFPEFLSRSEESNFWWNIRSNFILKYFGCHLSNSVFKIYCEFLQPLGASGNLSSFYHKIYGENILEVFRQITYGIDYLHSRQFNHEDLKGENILLYTNDYIGGILIKIGRAHV